MDLGAGAQFGRFNVEAFTRNVTDSRGLTSLFEPAAEAVFGTPRLPNEALAGAVLRPRTIGIYGGR